MSYEERNTVAHLISTVVVVSGFFYYMLQMAPLDAADPAGALAHLGLAFLVMAGAGIVVTILGTIFVNIGAGIAEGIRTGREPEFATDERDRQIELRAMRVASLLLGVGMVGSMALLAFGQPAFTVFLAIILAGAVADVAAGIFKLALYRRGF